MSSKAFKDEAAATKKAKQIANKIHPISGVFFFLGNNTNKGTKT